MAWAFGSRKKKKLIPAWRYTTGGVIWRLVPTGSRRLVGEERDLNAKDVSFFCLNQMTGKVLWERRRFDERWWIGIEAISRDTIFMHKYAKPDLPEHRGVIAVDVSTGRRLWSDDQLKFLDAVGERMFVVRESLEGNQLLELEARTGAVVRLEEEDERTLREMRNRGAAHGENGPELPLPILDISNDVSDAAMTVRKHCPIEDIIGLVEAIDLDRATVFNYHERSSRSTPEHMKVNNILKVVEKGSGETLFEDVVNGDSSGVVPESFFVQHEMLFFVQNRTTLTAVRIAPPADD